MIKVTAQQRANAIEARDVMWPSVPAQNVAKNLADWREPPDMEYEAPDCGSVACFGGWCQHWPSFKKQLPYEGVWPMYGSARELFGYSEMFRARQLHEKGTDHEVVTARINWLIANSEVQP